MSYATKSLEVPFRIGRVRFSAVVIVLGLGLGAVIVAKTNSRLTELRSTVDVLNDKLRRADDRLAAVAKKSATFITTSSCEDAIDEVSTDVEAKLRDYVTTSDLPKAIDDQFDKRRGSFAESPWTHTPEPEFKPEFQRMWTHEGERDILREAPVKGLSVAIKSHGRRVFVQLAPDSQKPGYLRLDADGGLANANLVIKRNGVAIATHAIGTDGTLLIPTSGISVIDDPGVGEFIYTATARISYGKGKLTIARARLVAQEFGS